ncbi:MAG TPA: hypothetical protein VEQ58_03995 [Polyangiaceae bacterium]|nr:hypothetical protein [Polyangiaceae bacterium]
MSGSSTLSPAAVTEIAQKHEVSALGLRAQLKMAETEGELDVEPTLNALRALLAILDLAEG